MFGYILALLVLGILLAIWLSGLARSGPEGQHGAAGKPVQHDFPAADAPTPDRSVTAPKSAVRSARRRTPPA